MILMFYGVCFNELTIKITKKFSDEKKQKQKIR